MSKDSLTSTASASTTSDQSISSAAASPAKTSLLPENEQVSPGSVPVSGISTPASSPNSDQIGFLLRTFLGSTAQKLTQFSVTWKRRATPAGRWFWELGASGLRTNAIELGFFATPTATMALETTWADDGRFFKLKSGRWRKRSKKGKDGSMNWCQEMACRGLTPTPELCEKHMGYPEGWTDLERSVTP